MFVDVYGWSIGFEVYSLPDETTVLLEVQSISVSVSMFQTVCAAVLSVPKATGLLAVPTASCIAVYASMS